MKISKSGRGYLRRSVVTYESIEESIEAERKRQADLRAAGFFDDARVKELEPYPRTREVLWHAERIMAAYLSKNELPHDAETIYSWNGKQWWKVSEGRARKHTGTGTLIYCIEGLGYEMGTREHLAANILMDCQLVQDRMMATSDAIWENIPGAEPPRAVNTEMAQGLDHAISTSIHLGRLVGLWNVYTSIHGAGAGGGHAGKRRAWATALARQLRIEHPAATKDAIWESIPEAEHPCTVETEDAAWKCYRDGTEVIAVRDCDGSVRTMSRTNFVRRYLKKDTKALSGP
ncbi:MAG TPA: hypothetical protein VFQ88_04625 [Nevskiaceae bacterium]|nr:hypothetical protein [Nevskiaceae bacterium]